MYLLRVRGSTHTPAPTVRTSVEGLWVLPLHPEFVKRVLIAMPTAQPDTMLHAELLCKTAGFYLPAPQPGNEINSINSCLLEQ